MSPLKLDTCWLNHADDQHLNISYTNTVFWWFLCDI